MPVQLNSVQRFVALTQRLHVEAGPVKGDAIAASFSGKEMQYLIVTADESPPIWVSEKEITTCWMVPNQ